MRLESEILRRQTAQPSKFFSTRLTLHGTSSKVGLQVVNPVSALFLTSKPAAHNVHSYLKGAISEVI